MHNNIHTYIEYSLDYFMSGFYEEAISLLKESIDSPDEVYPMVYYFLGWFTSQSGNIEAAENYFTKAEQMSPDFCFPNRLEELLALNCACSNNVNRSMALFYLGNFWYSNRQYKEALSCWEKSVRLNGNFPTVRRNLAIAYYNKKKAVTEAVEQLEKAFSLDTSDARILMELDQLNKKLGRPFSERLSFIEKYPEATDYRDDLYLETVALNNLMGKHEKALKLIMNRKFHPWEGGEGKVTGQYLLAHTEIAKKAIRDKNNSLALKHLKRMDHYPANLGEGKLFGTQENDINYWKGCAYFGLGDMASANEHWEKAAVGLSEPLPSMFYNDQQPDKIFYQGLALNKLARTDEARSKFNKLRDFGERHLYDIVKADYFAVSLPDLLIWDDDLQKRNTLHCLYLIGLGYLGFGEICKARKYFTKVLGSDIYHIGCRTHLAMCLVD
jgi:tetratricopeptide (TPR) repeat protein